MSKKIEIQIAKLFRSRDRMKDYLELKKEEEDWHGVQDAASDLRDIDATIEALEYARDNYKGE